MRAPLPGRRDGRVTVLVLGQTPPPWGGQAIGIKSFVDGRYEKIRVVHVRMAFSSASPGSALL